MAGSVHSLMWSVRRARTSGQGIVETAPEFNSPMRLLISPRQLSSASPSTSPSMLLRRESARAARPSGGRERACLRISLSFSAVLRL